ncbi:hypothetical protein AMELA_G00164680 [Ameiurus melas]|uniref:Ig-like domain-containing protein n=1 Tax=Ameiurus melas TaxID=219545 RepID=A0A7J6AG11_AMEME|nr:hypothetical protein AMELA_G00164680 [Ameiurus melas]
MENLGFVCLLLCVVSVHTANSEKLSCQEKNICTLKCGETNGNVTWSRDVDGKREKILTIYNHMVIKHITDPKKHYSSGEHLILSIFGFSSSDAGRYYCNENTVEVRVKSNTQIIMKTGDWLTVTAAGAGGCALVLVSLLVLWRCFSKRKGSTAETQHDSAEKGASDEVHFYESIYGNLSAPQPADPQQIPKDGFYHLATYPAIQNTR